MRVTQGMLSSQTLFDIENNNQRLSQLENEAATGNKINTPSDDPIGVTFVMQYTDNVAYSQQYQNNASQALGELQFVDGTMNEASQVMQRARDLAVQASNGTMTASDRAATAQEVDQLQQQLVSVGNSQYNGEYIYNGLDTSHAPYKSDGTLANAAAQTGSVQYDLGQGVHLDGSVTGASYFGADSDGDNAFQILSNLSTALNSNDQQAIQNSIGQIDSRTNTMSGQQATIGALTDRAQMMQTRLSDMNQNFTQLLATTQGADMASVITQLTTAQAVQQASLQVGARTLTPSLLSYLQ